MAGLNRSSWMAQRNAAQERESVVAELDHFPAEHQQSAARSGDEQFDYGLFIPLLLCP